MNIGIRQHRDLHSGFTLISVMIVVAIIGILAAIAYPSYMDYVRKSRRTGAISLLAQAANEQAQYYTLNHKYAKNMDELGLPDKTQGDWYKICVYSSPTTSNNSSGNAPWCASSSSGSSGGTNDPGFTVVAEAAKPSQKQDECYSYYINETGAKWATSVAATESDRKNPTTSTDTSELCW